MWINWVSRNILLPIYKFEKSIVIIKELFHFFCLIARICLNQRHNTEMSEKQKCFQLKKAETKYFVYLRLK